MKAGSIQGLDVLQPRLYRPRLPDSLMARPDLVKMLDLTPEIAALPQRFVMVLDDFYRADCPQLLELLSRWTRHWPLPMHLVIISRT